MKLLMQLDPRAAQLGEDRPPPQATPDEETDPTPFADVLATTWDDGGEPTPPASTGPTGSSPGPIATEPAASALPAHAAVSDALASASLNAVATSGEVAGRPGPGTASTQMSPPGVDAVPGSWPGPVVSAAIQRGTDTVSPAVGGRTDSAATQSSAETRSTAETQWTAAMPSHAGAPSPTAELRLGVADRATHRDGPVDVAAVFAPESAPPDATARPTATAPAVVERDMAPAARGSTGSQTAQTAHAAIASSTTAAVATGHRPAGATPPSAASPRGSTLPAGPRSGRLPPASDGTSGAMNPLGTNARDAASGGPGVDQLEPQLTPTRAPASTEPVPSAASAEPGPAERGRSGLGSSERPSGPPPATDRQPPLASGQNQFGDSMAVESEGPAEATSESTSDSEASPIRPGAAAIAARGESAAQGDLSQRQPPDPRTQASRVALTRESSAETPPTETAPSRPTPPADPTALRETIEGHLSRLRPIPHGGARVKIQLPEIGEVELRVRARDDGRYEVDLRATETQSARALLREQAALAEHLRLDGRSVELHVRAEDPSASSSDLMQERHGHGERSARGQARDDEPTPQTSRSPSPHPRSGRPATAGPSGDASHRLPRRGLVDALA
ncbi:MAG: hypothetical protein B7733_09530 [Myxococcales bacterium FL481]|nr:MAG: hypothetical protein B7733_09530 [Myxococcales bacterium FL481]